MTHLETFLALLATSSALPLLAFLAIVLRRNVVSGKLKVIVLLTSLLGLVYVIANELLQHRGEFGLRELYTGIIVSLLTFFVLSKSGHHHTHTIEESGVKGIILAEAFHSIFDGIAIGVTFLITPLLGAGAALGVLAHEIPKMIATLGLLRSVGFSMRKTIFYGILSQIGVPVTAVLVYLFGFRLTSEFHIADAAVIASLSTIVLYIVYLEGKHHLRTEKITSHTGHSTHKH